MEERSVYRFGDMSPDEVLGLILRIREDHKDIADLLDQAVDHKDKESILRLRSYISDGLHEPSTAPTEKSAATINTSLTGFWNQLNSITRSQRFARIAVPILLAAIDFPPQITAKEFEESLRVAVEQEGITETEEQITISNVMYHIHGAELYKRDPAATLRWYDAKKKAEWAADPISVISAVLFQRRRTIRGTILYHWEMKFLQWTAPSMGVQTVSPRQPDKVWLAEITETTQQRLDEMYKNQLEAPQFSRTAEQEVREAVARGMSEEDAWQEQYQRLKDQEDARFNPRPAGTVSDKNESDGEEGGDPAITDAELLLAGPVLDHEMVQEVDAIFARIVSDRQRN